MRLWTLAVSMACLVACAAMDAQAAGPQPPRKLVQRGGFVEYIRVPRNGGWVTRQVYSGYRNNFPEPAAFYYGYPHTEVSYSPGFYH